PDVARAQSERALAPPRRPGGGGEARGMTAAEIAKPSASVGIEPLILDFLAYLELERGLSRNTLEAYRSDLLQFGEYLDRHGLEAEAAAHGALAAFLSELARGDAEHPPVAPTTLGRKVACLRSFYRHLRREGIMEHDPTADLHGPRKPQRLPRVLSRDEVPRLLEQPRGGGPLVLRDRALLEVMYACGLRASEAVGLELGDLDLEEGLPRAGEGLEGAHRADRAPGGGGPERLPAWRAAAAARRRGAGATVRQPPRRGADAPGPLQDRPGPRAPGGPAGADEPPHPAPLLRHAPAGRRVRPALAAGDARPRRPRDHSGLHAPGGRPPQGCVLRRAPAGVALSSFVDP